MEYLLFGLFVIFYSSYLAVSSGKIPLDDRLGKIVKGILFFCFASSALAFIIYVVLIAIEYMKK
jgi:hypothetical protein